MDLSIKLDTLIKGQVNIKFRIVLCCLSRYTISTLPSRYG